VIGDKRIDISVVLCCINCAQGDAIYDYADSCADDLIVYAVPDVHMHKSSSHRGLLVRVEIL